MKSPKSTFYVIFGLDPAMFLKENWLIIRAKKFPYQARQ